MIDYSHVPLNTKTPGHLYPIKSALKGGSGPPSIISEAISEESRSSLGTTQDKKAKARVSFSDEQQASGQQIMDLGQKGGKNGFLKPENAAILAKSTPSAGATGAKGSVSVSPPLSPPLSPQIPVAVPPRMSARTSIPSGNVQVASEGPSSLTPASTLQGSPLQRESTPPSSSQSKEVTQSLKTTPAAVAVTAQPLPDGHRDSSRRYHRTAVTGRSPTTSALRSNCADFRTWPSSAEYLRSLSRPCHDRPALR